MPVARRFMLTAAAGLPVACAFSRAALAAGVTINGSGSGLAAEVARRWIETAPDTVGATVVYEVADAAPTRNAVMGGDVDFALAEDPMDAKTLDLSDVAQFPVAFTAIAVVVSLPGVQANQLKLSGPVLGGIFDGSIKKWNDPAIAALNGGLSLPDLAIAPVAQGSPSEAPSGVSYGFTQYLLAANPGWRQKHGAAAKAGWSAGKPALDQAAAIYQLQSAPGTITYMPAPAAEAGKLTTAQVVNKAGKPVAPDAASLSAAVAAIDWPKAAGLTASVSDAPGAGSWPIVAVTYAQIPRTPKKKPKGVAVKAFFKNVIANGGDAAAQKGAAGLPPPARDPALAILDTVNA